MYSYMYGQYSFNWNVKSMNSMSILLILLLKFILFQSNSIFINADELNLNTNNNLSNIPNDQQRAQALAKLMSLFYTSDAFNKYMENLDAYYMLRGRPRFGKRNYNPIKDNNDLMKNDLINNYLRQKLLQKYLIDNYNNDGDENFLRN
ncbi:putative neuropeptide F precursor [Schistosoma mansoni]|uniref:Neuropeptide F n=1 Tax=Schistosoma mansoni TaxID=6183 RepID=Q7Z157_SCHMA|nr:putative neuropeptide F precursor [Schistosoma mansoni]AAP57535.1 neuropeptide F precursor [Schistosoma mansoni]AAT77204.1 neuropeptide F precursor [Schistosoma mansoni]|eukprot:XP_018654478.1 putative neuropeptide F precursor [Schistosoma mansoni]